MKFKSSLSDKTNKAITNKDPQHDRDHTAQEYNAFEFIKIENLKNSTTNKQSNNIYPSRSKEGFEFTRHFMFEFNTIIIKGLKKTKLPKKINLRFDKSKERDIIVLTM